MQLKQGTDITSVQRISDSITRSGKSFLDRIFTPEEQSYCDTKRMKFEHYAARFAAKEAFMKAVEVEDEKRIDFNEIEVRKHASGKPFIAISEAVLKKLSLPNDVKFELSMAHEREYATATVLMILP